MAEEIKLKEGKEFWEFVRRTAEEVSTWRECREPAKESLGAAPRKDKENIGSGK